MRCLLNPVYAVTLLLLLGNFTKGELLEARLDLVKVPERETPSMRVSEVRPGMRGICLTVFAGTKIEPFEVEVLSVVNRQTPGQAVVWMRSLDPRMVESGPVQGMSGSPVYLWDGSEPNDPSDERLGGGRLIGAFAFGYSLSKGCLIGVQPIEQMVPVGERIGQAPVDYAKGSMAALQQVRENLGALTANPGIEARAGVWEDLLEQWTRGAGKRSTGADDKRLQPMALPVAGLSDRVLDLGLPLSMGGPLELVGDGGSGRVGPPPAWIDPETKIEPGSVFAVTLATGDLDMAGVGTTTDVRPDGTVLAFGHSMNSEGSSALPMSTGYVHFIVPRITSSFKRGTPLRMAGTVLQDESAAVAGRSVLEHEMADVSVAVSLPGQPDRDYSYQVVRHPSYTATLSAIVSLESVVAHQEPPIETTTRYRLNFAFDDGRTLEISNTSTMGTSAVYSAILPVVSTAMENPFEPLRLSSLDVSIDVEEGLREGEVLNARLEKTEFVPGEDVVVYAEVMSYRGETKTVSLSLTVPEDLPDGDYQLIVGGQSSHLMRRQRTQPHLFTARNVNELFSLIDEVENLPAEGLYALMVTPKGGLVDGREVMPDLPSHVRSTLSSSGKVMPFTEVVTARSDVNLEIYGEFQLTLTVKKP